MLSLSWMNGLRLTAIGMQCWNQNQFEPSMKQQERSVVLFSVKKELI